MLAVHTHINLCLVMMSFHAVIKLQFNESIMINFWFNTNIYPTMILFYMLVLFYKESKTYLYNMHASIMLINETHCHYQLSSL